MRPRASPDLCVYIGSMLCVPSELLLSAGLATGNPPDCRLQQSPAVPRVTGERHAAIRLLREGQGGSVATEGDQTQSAGGATPSAHAVANHGRQTVKASEMCLSSKSQFVSFWLTRYREVTPRPHLRIFPVRTCFPILYRFFQQRYPVFVTSHP